MLAPTYTETEKLLLDLADVVEKSIMYDQRIVEHTCGTPGCAYGHLQLIRPGPKEFFSAGSGPLAEDLGLTFQEFCEIFSSDGCDNAGTDGRKAAIYLRRFVARKVRERLEAE